MAQSFDAATGDETGGADRAATRMVPDLRQFHALTGRPLDEAVSPEELEMAVAMGWIGEVEQAVSETNTQLEDWDKPQVVSAQDQVERPRSSESPAEPRTVE